MPRLSIVIPAYAEAMYLGATLATVRAYLVERGRLDTTELVVVTADAPDGTAAIARTELRAFPLAQHVEPGPKVGKGRDVRAGMLTATGDIVMFMDADLATPLAHVETGVAAIEAGDDIVIGTRELARIHRDLARGLTSRWANAMIQTLLLPGFRDTQCGFKLFARRTVRALFEPLATTGWGFDFEVLARAQMAGFRVRELLIPDWFDPKGDNGLAGEVQWWARIRTMRDLLKVVARHGRQRPHFQAAEADATNGSSRVSSPRWVRTSRP
ncbi:MAG: glycosyltransferase [Kofleriaceae bacterium]|nr:glycosyltransferase [Kofleriaceae bacterium]